MRPQHRPRPVTSSRMIRVGVLLALGFFGLRLVDRSSAEQFSISSQQQSATTTTAETPIAPVPPAKTGDRSDATPPLGADGFFDPGANGNVLTIAVQSDEKIIIGGDFTTVGGVTRNRIARIYSDGTVDPNFNPGANGTVNQVLIQPNGEILVAGNFTMLGGGTGTIARSRIGRIHPDGTLDPNFVDPGVNSAIYGMALQSNGRIIIGGAFTTLQAQQNVSPYGLITVTRNFIAQLETYGRVTNGFSPEFNPGANNSVFKVAVQPDDKLIVVGAFTTLGGGGLGTTTRNRIGRLNSNGTLDTTFNPGANNSIAAVLRQSDGKIVVGGAFSGLGGGTGTTTRNRLGRLNTDGSVDATFNPGANNDILSLTQQTDGKLLAVGNFTALGGGGTGSPSHNFIGRVNLDGSLDAGFNGGANAGVSAATPTADGSIVVGGAFSTLGVSVIAARLRIGQLKSDGTVDTSVFPHNDNFINAQVISGASGKIYGANNGATKETGEPQHAGQRGGTSVWYRWQSPFTGVVNFTTFGSDFDTILAAYNGTSVNALTQVANGSNDDNTNPDNKDGRTLTSSISFSAVSGTIYYLAVDGSGGRTGAIRLDWGIEASIGGQVSISPYEVTIILAGDDSRAVIFPAGVGTYNFQHLRAGRTYTVGAYPPEAIASGPCALFRPPLQFAPLAVSISNADFIDEGHCSVVGAGAISGLVRRTNGVGIPGIAVSITGTANRTVVTDENGRYDASDLPLNGTYTVKPSSSIFTFSPLTRSFTSAFDILGADFVAGDSLEISGQTRRSDGALISAAIVTLNTNPIRTAQTDAGGYYSFSVPAGVSYALTATKTGVSFIQPTLTLSNVSTHQKNVDFIAGTVTISGRATNINGRGLSGKTVTLSGSASASQLTNSDGAYSFTVTSGGTYDVTPSDSQFQVGWSPANSIHHANLTQNVIDDFEARTPQFTVAGVVKNTANANLAGVTVRLTGTLIVGGNKVQLKDYTTSSNGSYTSDALNIFGDYTFTPQTSIVSGATYGNFSPASRSFNSILPCASVPGATCDNNTSTQNYLGADFTATAIRVLTVASTNPASGASISVSPNDNSTQGNGSTQFTRTYNVNTVVSLTAATTAGGNDFQKWLKDGVDFAVTPATSVTMDTNHTMTAVYVAPKTVQLSSSAYSFGEAVGLAGIQVTRSGDASNSASVNYTTSDTAGASPCDSFNTGKASSRCDYETTLGTLKFAAGETSKAISIPVIDDAYNEGNEALTITLTNPVNVSLGAQSSATITIIDDSTPAQNPINDATFFTKLHYFDFLNREADTPGLNFWRNEITSCGSDTTCTEVHRISVSASFFVSIEFKETGYLVERAYKASYGDIEKDSSYPPPVHKLKVPIIRFQEFLADTQQITEGVIVLAPGWEQKLESNKVAFFADFVQRARFTTALPTTLTPAQFVDQLNTNAGNALSTSERTTAINLFGGAGNTTNTTARAQALRQVAEDADLATAEINRAFVLMQYYGYLRRNPDDPPEASLDYAGYEFWLIKLNLFGGDYRNAEMVKAFLSSIEYNRRFGP
jgi:uncharacterized delta-60 repeat protein